MEGMLKQFELIPPLPVAMLLEIILGSKISEIHEIPT